MFFAAKSGVRFSLKGKHGSVGLSVIKADAVVIVREATGGVFRFAERRARKKQILKKIKNFSKTCIKTVDNNIDSW